MAKPNIMIGLTAYGGAPKLACTKSLFRFFQAANARGIGTALKTLDMTGISTARNVIASIFYASEQFTHLLFLDDDMSVQPDAILRLPDAGKPLIGLAYPRREIDISKTLAEARKGADDRVAIARSLSYSMLALNDADHTIQENGMVQVSGVGMGVTLIARTVFEQLSSHVRRHNKHKMAGHGLTTPLYGFFDLLYEDEDETSEDFSFCLRWKRHCNGEVWAIINEEVGHVGEFIYRARMSDSL